MLSRELACALDPVRLARRVGVDPDPWQSDLLRSQGRQSILLCSRQSGKSTVSSVVALHTALYRAPALVLCLSPSQRQSGELFRKIREGYGLIGGPAPREESALRMSLPNGSRIIALPGKEATIRGFSGVSLLLVDEASRVPDALYQAVRPMLAVSGGRIVLLSTPFGKRGFFFHEWTEGGESWKRVKLVASQCPRIPADWLAEERRAIGERMFAQEYLCEFVELDDQVFSYDLVQAALSDDITPLFGVRG